VRHDLFNEQAGNCFASMRMAYEVMIVIKVAAAVRESRSKRT
jgi:hypothetical protein